MKPSERETPRFPHRGHLTQTIPGIFQNTVALMPQKTAIIFKSESITYHGLNTKANQLAGLLTRAGAGPGVMIAVCMPQGIERVIYTLAVMKTGAAYVPLDPEYPEARLHFILSDTGAAFVLTSSLLRSKFPEYPGRIILPEEEQTAALPAEDLQVNIQPDDILYVIYTSGSTGVPKGVVVEQGAVLSFIQDYPEAIGITSESIAVQLLSFSFDAAFMDLWIPLLVGATLHLYPDNKLLGEALMDYIRQHHINILAMITPTILASLPTNGDIGHLKIIGVGGDVCPENLVLHWMNKVKLYNAYGPTETTIAVTCHPYQPGQSARTIGKPLGNVTFHALDTHLQPVPVGSEGELFIGGAQLAREYLHRPDITAERFLQVTTGNLENRRLYKTGDLVRMLPDGNWEFIGRNDQQIKVRGFRIEPGEIERAITGIPDVKEAVVTAVKMPHEQTILAAFITPRQFTTPDEVRLKTDIRSRLQQQLPAHMVPDRLVILEKMPITPNGKISKEALSGLVHSEQLSLEGISEDNIEDILAAVWKHVLQLAEIAATDNFTALGGHSLSAVRIFTALPELLRKNLQLADIYQFPTIEKLAAEIRRRQSLIPLSQEERMKVNTDILLNDIKLDACHDYPTAIDPSVLANPQRILLTGATGFVGSHLLLELIEKTNADIYCLVRAQNKAHAMERIKSVFDRYRLKWPATKAHRIIPVTGDFCFPYLGMPARDFYQLAEEIEIVYHSGGSVNYIQPYSILKSVNVDGAQQVILFATTGKLKYLIECSTIGVFSWGRPVTGKTWMREDDPIDQNLPAICRDMNYVRSKWVAEKILDLAQKKGLPVINFRLGFVMCNSQTGATEMNQWWGSLVRSCLSTGTFPLIMGLKDELVTVDFVAQAIVHIAKNKDAVGKNFHLVPEPYNDLSVTDFFVKINEHFNTGLTAQPFPEWLLQWKNNQNNALYSLLSLFTEDVDRGKSLMEVYENTYYLDKSNTDTFLAGSGIRPTAITKELLTVYLDYMGVLPSA